MENSEDSISTDDLELIRYLHVPVDGLICLFEGLLFYFKLIVTMYYVYFVMFKHSLKKKIKIKTW